MEPFVKFTLHEARLEKGTERFRVPAGRDFHRVLLPFVEDEEHIGRDAVSPLRRRVPRRTAQHGLDRQRRLVIGDGVIARVAMENRRTVRKVGPSRIDGEAVVAHLLENSR